LTAAYFRLLFVAMVVILELHADVGEKDDASGVEVAQAKVLVKYSDFFGLYKSILGAEKPLTDAIQVDTHDDQLPRNDFKMIRIAFLAHLRICNDAAIGTQLLETLSVFSIHSENDISLSEMIDLSWRGLHSDFSGGEAMRNFRAPFAFLAALRRRVSSSLFTSAQMNTVERSVHETIVKVAFSKSKSYEKHFFLIHGMLRHWGLLALSEGKQFASFDDHLHQLLTNLKSFLGEVHGPLVAKLQFRKDDGTSDEDDEYIPPQHKRDFKPVLPTSSVPGLSANSFPIYFHVLLHMTVAAFSICSITGGGNGIDPAVLKNRGPFVQLENRVEMFGSLIELYKDRVQIFPRQVLATVVNASRSILTLTVYQVQRCIEWRNSHPTLSREEIEAGAFDVASIRFLKSLLDAFGIHVVGNLTSLCDCIELPSNNEDGAHFGSGQKQKIKSLRLKIDRVFSELGKTAMAHKLAQPQLDMEAKEADEQPAKKRRRIETKGFLQFEDSTEESDQLNRGGEGVNDVERPSESAPFADNRRLARPDVETQKISSELSSDEFSNSDSSESFGVSGDWGQESDDDESASEIKL
jgi:hypothetical protein